MTLFFCEYSGSGEAHWLLLDSRDLGVLHDPVLCDVALEQNAEKRRVAVVDFDADI